MCACFAKTSVIWIPLLYMGTSTQFKLRFVNHSRTNHRRKPDITLDQIVRKYTLIHNNHNLNSSRTEDKHSDDKRHPSTQTKI